MSLSGRPIINVEKSRGYVWDTGTLAWIPAVPGTAGGGGTEYTEDAAAAANPVGGMTMLVRKDTPASEVTADGDNIAARATAHGSQYVTLLDTAGNPVSVGGGTQYTEDVPAAADPIGTALNLVRADALAAVTTLDGDNVAARGTNKGELYVKHVDSIPVTDNAGSLTVDNPTLSVVGGGVEATALRVTIANDSTGLVSVDDNGGSLTVDGTVAVSGTVATKEIRSGTSAVTSVADNAANVTLLAANANRLGASIKNDSSARLFIKLGATATTASHSAMLEQNGYYEVPSGYTGIIDGIWASDPNDGAARITELTA